MELMQAYGILTSKRRRKKSNKIAIEGESPMSQDSLWEYTKKRSKISNSKKKINRL